MMAVYQTVDAFPPPPDVPKPKQAHSQLCFIFTAWSFSLSAELTGFKLIYVSV